VNAGLDDYALGLDDERRPRSAAILLAILLHALVLFVAIDPSLDSDIPQAVGSSAPRLAAYLPAPPPPPARPQRVHKRVQEFAPIPDPEPEIEEPVFDESLPEMTPLEISDPLLGQPTRPSPIYGGPAGAGGAEPIQIGDGSITPPIPIKPTHVTPRYPDAARTARATGMVILLAVVTKKGDVDRIQVLREMPGGYGLSKLSVEAVQQWKYIPAKKNGEPVSVWMNITVHFNLSQQ